MRRPLIVFVLVAAMGSFVPTSSAAATVPPSLPPSLVVTFGDEPPTSNGALRFFGPQVPVGGSQDVTVVLANGAGAAPLQVESVVLAGDPEIALVAPVATVPVTVEASGGLNVVLRCTQVSLKRSMATLTIVSDDPDDSPFVLRMLCSSFGLPDESEPPDAVALPDAGARSYPVVAAAAVVLGLGVLLRRLSRARRVSAG